MKSLMILLGSSVCLSAWAGVTAYWTGAQDSYWTNAANWSVGGSVPSVCPGVVSNDVDGVFAPALPSKDKVIFDGRCTSGNTTINLDGLYSISCITVTGADAPKYAFGTDDSQYLPFETNGAFLVEASVPAAHAPEINANVAFPANIDDSWWSGNSASGDILTLENACAGTLVVNGSWGTGTPWYRPNGKAKSYMEATAAINVTAGTLRFTGGQRHATFLYSYKYRISTRMEVLSKDFMQQKQLTFSKNGTLYIGDGVTFGHNAANNAGYQMNGTSHMVFEGPGTTRFAENTGGNSFDNHAFVNCYNGILEVRSRVAVASSSATRPYVFYRSGDRQGRIRLYASEPGDLKRGFYCNGYFTLEVPSVDQLAQCDGLMLCSSNVKPTDPSKTNWGAYLYSYATVDWTGAEPETFTTAVTNYGGNTTLFTLRNSGAARLTAGMAVNPESDAVAVRLEGVSAPIVYAATLSRSLPVTLAGDVILEDGVDMTNVAGLRFESARLRVANDQEGFTLPPVTLVSGDNRITISGGRQVVMSALTRTAGTLDVVREGDAKLVCMALAGTRPDWLTVNGRPAEVRANGAVMIQSMAHDVEIDAKGDTVPHAPENVVGVVTEGSAGNNVLVADATAVKGLVQKSDWASTVAIGAGQCLTVDIVTIADGAQSLTVGDVAGQGTLAAGEAGLTLCNETGSSGLTINAKVAAPAGKPLAVLDGHNIKLNGGSDGALALNVGNAEVTLSGENAYTLDRLLVATNVAGVAATLILDGAREVTLPETTDRFSGVLGGVDGNSGWAQLDGRAAVAKLVVTNATLRSVAWQTPTFVGDNTNSSIVAGYYGNGIVEVLEGGRFQHRLLLGGRDGDSAHPGSGAVYQRGGLVELLGIDYNNYHGASYLGGYNANNGYYELTGGRFCARGCLCVGVISSYGVFHQLAGLSCFSNPACTGLGKLVVGASNQGHGQVYVSDATCDCYADLALTQTFSGYSENAVTVTGERGYFNNYERVIKANQNAPDSTGTESMVNIRDGAILKCAGFSNRIYKDDDTTANHYFHVWFDRGTLRLGGNNRDIATGNDTPAARCHVNAFLVGEGGAVVDTDGKSGNSSSVAFAAPVGQVVAVKDFVPCAGRLNNVGAPYARVVGDGHGATAVALFDSVNRVITNVVVTSGGTGYTTAKIQLEYVWNDRGAPHKTYECVVAGTTSGGFTKSGEGDFTFNAANTYGGDTVLKGGTLKLAAAGALPLDSVVHYEGGSLEATSEACPPVLKVYIPGAEATVRACNLLTFSDSMPTVVPTVEVVNALEREKGRWVASFYGNVLRVVKVNGLTINFR
ncbi:MAG: hypothetical protein MJ240_12000 [Kiritimatiellae bacterium]|nr:hypothetical protein [Kiritimatiellia bacterium]